MTAAPAPRKGAARPDRLTAAATARAAAEGDKERGGAVPPPPDPTVARARRPRRAPPAEPPEGRCEACGQGGKNKCEGCGRGVSDLSRESTDAIADTVTRRVIRVSTALMQVPGQEAILRQVPAVDPKAAEDYQAVGRDAAWVMRHRLDERMIVIAFLAATAELLVGAYQVRTQIAHEVEKRGRAGNAAQPPNAPAPPPAAPAPPPAGVAGADPAGQRAS